MTPVSRLKITVRGAVQGVGFRPFVYQLATDLGLHGWVNNSAQGVFIEVEGPHAHLETFLLRLGAETPPLSFIQSLEPCWMDGVGYPDFGIRDSESGGAKTTLVLPDIATCPECRREIFDPADRRYLYPFTNCTHCGPRFSIIESLPYDRANTSMRAFAMCPRCDAEYHNPRDRRFHAQPNACPACGPRLEVWDCDGRTLGSAATPEGALRSAAEAIRAGSIVAVKGLGGFHLMVAAHDAAAVRRLRERKHREEKPFAVMFPSVAAIRQSCEVSLLEERLLLSPEAPIVLLSRRAAGLDGLPVGDGLAPSLAPRNPNLGVMLPYTPLHLLLLSLLGFPVVATSGNLSDEPICTDERDAIERLGRIADLFLVHNRPIVRHVDDSIVRLMAGREMVLRRARGYAPLPVSLPASTLETHQAKTGSVLAVGAHLKNTIALAVGQQAFLSQHIGDLETDAAFEAFRRVIADFETLYEAPAATVVADAHPDYLSSKFARDRSEGPAAPRLVQVQHHVAHVLACVAENELPLPALGVAWDGTGYGLDGTVWGGEFFLVTDTACERVAHLRPFPLPGGDKAVKEPRRTALGLLFAMEGESGFSREDLPTLRAFSPAELTPLQTMLGRRLNSPLTSSVGRLFDAVASLIGLRQETRFEGQAAMELEFAIKDPETAGHYPVAWMAPPAPRGNATSPALLDWQPLIEAILYNYHDRVPTGIVASRFHNTLAEAIVVAARRFKQERVALSGGCFQNRYLTERAIRRLREEGFRPYWHQRVPPNDGGIALGQIVAAGRGCSPELAR
jgi:hydrogenase maturation protein HypF